MGAKPSLISLTPLIQDYRLLEMCEYSFDFFKLEDLAKIVSLSKRFMNTLAQSPRILISMIKKFYMSQNHVHPRVRRYFQILLTKRQKINISNLSEIAKEIYLLAEYRVKISRNLIRDVYCTKNKDQISEIKGIYYWRDNIPDTRHQDPLIIRKHGGDGWKLEKDVIPEFRKRTLATSYHMGEISYKAYFKQFSSGFLEDLRNGKTVLKAGCFISRRGDCEANGGCVLQIFSSDNHLSFEVKQHQKNEEIPIYKYQEIAFTIAFKDLPQNINLDRSYMKLIIYGQDERFWAGNYGSRFIAMYIRGDYVENPLNNLLN